MARDRIYLDYAASSPLKPEVRAAMMPWLGVEYGNASSLHAEGRAAKAAIDVAREAVSTALNCEFGEVIFTSGGTEAANLAVLGTAVASVSGKRKRVLIGAAEHHCVFETEPLLTALGFTVERIPVDRYARVDLETLEQQLGEDVLSVHVMYANNELGTWQPVKEVATLVHVHGALFHCDAVQAFGLPGTEGIAWTVGSLAADLVSISAHKLGGPKGAGALYVKAGTALKPIVVGGGQEREVRAGTENVAAIVGFGEATKLATDGSCRRQARDAFASHLVGVSFSVPEAVAAHPGICHLRVPDVDAESILIRLDRAGVSASSGAACSSGSLEPSHVLTACGYSPAEAKQGLRFSFGDETSVESAIRAAAILNQVVTDVSSVRAG